VGVGKGPFSAATFCAVIDHGQQCKVESRHVSKSLAVIGISAKAYQN